jgi:hypothetical protein
MIARLLIVAAVLPLAGCDAVLDGLDRVFRALDGRDRQLVILAPQPVVLTDKPAVFSGSEPLKVVGEWTSLCLVLRGDVPLQQQSTMDQIFSAALSGAKVRVNVVLNDGARISLHEPMQGWSRSGRILPRNEFSACASASCGSHLPVGAIVKRLEVSATPKLEVRGIFWQSEQGPNEKARTSPTTTAQRPNEQSKCDG